MKVIGGVKDKEIYKIHKKINKKGATIITKLLPVVYWLIRIYIELKGY